MEEVSGFIKYIRAEKRYSEHTVSNYRRDIDNFLKYLSDKSRIAPEELKATAVTNDDIRSWIMELTGKGLAPATVNRMCSSVRSFFGYLRKEGIVKKNPFLRIGNHKKSRKLPSYIPESGMQEVMCEESREMSGATEKSLYLTARNELIVLLFYSTGIRLAELTAIRLGDFSDDLSELKIRGKGGKERIVPVIKYTRDKIASFLDRFNGDPVCFSHGNSLFLTVEQEPLSRSSVYAAVREKLAKAGVQGKKSPHVLRHTFATHLLNDGADIREIQELLGHSSLNATQVYTHNSIAKLKEAYGKAHPRARKEK